MHVNDDEFCRPAEFSRFHTIGAYLGSGIDVEVPADRTVFVSLTDSETRACIGAPCITSCANGVSFSPKPGAAYAARLTYPEKGRIVDVKLIRDGVCKSPSKLALSRNAAFTERLCWKGRAVTEGFQFSSIAEETKNWTMGPKLVARDRVAENYQRLATANRLKNALFLGTPAGFPGAMSSLSGQDEYQVAAAHEIGGPVLALGMVALGNPARQSITLQPVGFEKFNMAVDSYINMGKQERHILNGKSSEGKGYFKTFNDAQDFLTAYQRGQTMVIGRGSDGGHIVRYEG